MIDYSVVSLRDAIDVFGLGSILNAFESFSCENEKDLEMFLRERAIRYEDSSKGRTFLIIDDAAYKKSNEVSIVAYFTLALTSIDLGNFGINKKKKIVGDFPNRDQLDSFPAFLIGQLGRSGKYTHEDIDGETIIYEAFSALKPAAYSIGGKLVVLECREHMYSKVYERLGFKKLDENLNSENLYMLYRRVDFQDY